MAVLTTTLSEPATLAVPVAPVSLVSPDPAGGMLDALAAYVLTHPEMEDALLAALLGKDGMSPTRAVDAVGYPGDSEVEDRVKAAKVEAKDGAQ